MGTAPVPQDRTFSSAEACELAGITYRQLDYWARLGYIAAQVPAQGSGSRRRWTPHQVGLLAVVGAAAPYVRNIRHMEHLLGILADWPMTAWGAITLLIDGTTGEVWLPGRDEAATPAVAIAVNLAGIKTQVRDRFEMMYRAAA